MSDDFQEVCIAILAVLFIIFTTTLMTGCVPSNSIEKSAPFEAKELDSAMAIIVDVSGSFQDRWDENAFRMFADISQRFFKGATGSEAKLIISQLSANDTAVLFEGRPSEFRRKFQTPQEFSEFLRSNSDPSRSQVYEATRQTIDYMNQLDGVTSQTQMLTIILSDMKDSTKDWSGPDSSGQAMFRSLKHYRELGGALALYYVANDEVASWKELLGEAGFEPGYYTIENEISASPSLPTFD